MSHRVVSLLASVLWLSLSDRAIADRPLPSAMEADPKFSPRATVHEAPDRLLPLWLETISQSEVEAEVVSQTAVGLVRMRRLGINVDQRLGAAIIDQLAAQLKRPDQDFAMKLAIANAIVQFDASRHANLLATQLVGGELDVAEIVEPALAHWGDTTLREQWLARLKDSNTPTQLMLLAIRAVGSLKETGARESLVRIALDENNSPAIRMASASSLSELRLSGLEAHARRLLQTEGERQIISQLLAIRMLAGSSGPQVENLLEQVADAQEPAVAAVAVERLMELRPSLDLERRRQLLQSGDPKLRLLGIAAVAINPNPDASELLGNALDDRHLQVRRAAGKALIEAASAPERRDDVSALASRLLDPARPLQTEQSLQTLATIDAKSAGPQILELLDVDDPRVSVTAAWALERLATPEIAEQIFAHVVKETDRTAEAVRQLAPLYQQEATPDVQLPRLDDAYRRVEHLIVALGQVRYREADLFLRRFIAKPTQEARKPPPLEAYHQPRPRAAAIWTLGKIYANDRDQAPAELIGALAERMGDSTPIPREDPLVRSMAAISLGRIGSPGTLPLVQDALVDVGAEDEVGRACGWAIERISGKPVALVGAKVVSHSDWFLVPID